MLGLPKIGDKVKVWPRPGRRVQATEFPCDVFRYKDRGGKVVSGGGGGHFLPESGELVVWGLHHLNLLRSGDILMHAPPVPLPLRAVEPAKPYDFHTAAQAEHAAIAKALEDAKPKVTATVASETGGDFAPGTQKTEGK